MDKLIACLPTPLQPLCDPVIERAGVRVYIKRDDLIHPTVSGNKWRKLKYNLKNAVAEGMTTVLTFGGAYSNHLYATAAACNLLGLRSIGVVRGEDHGGNLSATLKFCAAEGMTLYYISREEYRQRNDENYLRKIRRDFGDPYLIPEGGTTGLALKGVSEMTFEVDEHLGQKPDYYAVASGTGGTAAGILAVGNQVLAFSALRGGHFLEKDILELIVDREKAGDLVLFTDYHFGGYAKWTPELIQFMNQFWLNHKIQLEQVYTAKMFFGLYDLIRQGYFRPGTVIVAVHTGGLQGLLGEKN